MGDEPDQRGTGRRSNGGRGAVGRGAAPGEADEDGTTPLYQAAVHGSTEIVRLLLKYGADPNAATDPVEEGLPLCAAACWNHTGVVAALLAAGADPDLPEPPYPEQTGPGTSPLLWAVRNGHRETVNLLLAVGADPDIAPTPLPIAARGGRYGIVRSLLDHGADPARTDQDGRTAAQLAAELAGTDPVGLLAGSSGWDGHDYTVHWQPAGDGTELITLRYNAGGGETSIQDGHSAIAALLQASNEAGPA